MEIETARLRLRPVVQDDLDALHRLWIDAEVRRYLWDDEVISRERAQVEIDSSLASFESHGFGHWIVIHEEDHAPIGFCGLRPDEDHPEILFGLAPGYWGQGLALEAVRAVLRYGFEEKNLSRIVGKADLPNLRSFRVMEKAGMRFQRDTRNTRAGLRHFAITREEFKQTSS
jgi:ribosomal-protein-alanine N-acetyltransferase